MITLAWWKYSYDYKKKHFQMNQILALNNLNSVNMQLNK